MSKKKALSGTFVPNKNQAIHRWYPYMEGYSSSLVEEEINKIDDEIYAIYDPFGGSGTTPLMAAQLGIDAYYSETNPFMAYICDMKINGTKEALNLYEDIVCDIKQIIESINDSNDDGVGNIDYQGFEKYYNADVLKKVIAIKNKTNEYSKSEISKKVSLTALSCILVSVSNMVRRGDLRYAKPNEKKNEDFDVVKAYEQKINEILEDIVQYGETIKTGAIKLSADAREITEKNFVNCVITSPPYLNGTNYIRNTKLELKLLDFINDENDLPKFHSKGIVAGINNVSKRNESCYEVPEVVREIIETLEPVSYDTRITLMIAGYFNDMNNVFEKLKNIMVNGGYFIMDIGDSQFAGVHVPTHDILSKLALTHGFKVYDETILRSRRSKNGMILTQRVIRYRLNK